MTDRFDEIEVGLSAEFVHTVTADDIDGFARLTGDDNPLHMDDDYAAQTSFRRRLAHGMLTASFISTVIGTRLPGPGALWYEQSLRFLAPVRPGDRIRVRATVLRKSQAERLLVLETLVFADNGRKLIEGEAKVKVLKSEREAAPAVPAQPGPVIITGAAGGIGSAIVRALATAGHPVVLAYHSSASAANAIAESIVADGGSATAIAADVSRPEDVALLVDETAAAYGGVFGIVNNASPPLAYADFDAVGWNDFQRHFDVQLRGSFELVKKAVPLMMKGGGGCVVNIGSIGAEGVPPPRMMPYTVAKASLLALTRAMAAELGPKGIRVNAVSPGITRTGFIDDMPEKAKLLARMQTPLRRLGEPADVASAVAYLMSDGACHINGQNLRVCGGALMG